MKEQTKKFQIRFNVNSTSEKDRWRLITVKEESVMTRHILKTVSYRVLGTLTTVFTAYSLGVSLELSSLLGVGELMIKPTLYFFHERVWYKHIRIKKD